MHSVQSVTKQSKLSRRQRRRQRYCKAYTTAAAATASSSSSSAYASKPHISGYKVAKAYRYTVPIVHGIVVSNLSLVLLQKEYIEQFYFEKRSGGGGPDPDANADLYRHLKTTKQIHCTAKTIAEYQHLPLLRFG
ncbi:uncharacterized protein LOC119603735 [Lucilia sericata]|uniref:uncharacterized protein LOC119603735 n=1 Tax=Lucilia sericata TaxID=13632 RepID=UPI0018A85183|nr:uncharacterized protein LOC119603735 [Lucilia sericata]